MRPLQGDDESTPLGTRDSSLASIPAAAGESSQLPVTRTSTSSLDRMGGIRGASVDDRRLVPGMGMNSPQYDVYNSESTTTANPNGAGPGGALLTRDKLVKKRKRRVAAGGATVSGVVDGSGRGGADASFTSAEFTHGGAGEAPHGTRKRQSFGRRFARVRWAAMMWIPLILVLLHRSERLAVDTDERLTAVTILAASGALSTFILINELCDGVQWPYYCLSLATGVLWGGVNASVRDLTAARLISVLIFGIAAGQLRYHWDIKEVRTRRRAARTAAAASSSVGGSGGLADRNRDGSNQSSDVNGGGGGSTPVGGRRRAQSDAASLVAARGYYPGPQIANPLPRILAFLARSVGLGPWFAIGEIVGCALLVPDGYAAIANSGTGYVLVILFPLITYKLSSWVSHVGILVFGSRVHTADASRLLYAKWAVTTVLAVTIHFVVIGFVLYNLLPYIWSLQLLVAPYCLVFEVVSWESRHQQLANPYKEVAENYAEHINYIKERKAEFF